MKLKFEILHINCTMPKGFCFEKNIEDILLDDYRARITAKINGLYPIGTIGVLLQAKKIGSISNVKPLLDKLMRNKVRIGSALYDKALELAKENK